VVGKGGPQPAPSKLGVEIIASIKAMRRIAFIYHGQRRWSSRNVSASHSPTPKRCAAICRTMKTILAEL
jgi:hypothetical protein